MDLTLNTANNLYHTKDEKPSEFNGMLHKRLDIKSELLKIQANDEFPRIVSCGLEFKTQTTLKTRINEQQRQRKINNVTCYDKKK